MKKYFRTIGIALVAVFALSLCVPALVGAQGTTGQPTSPLEGLNNVATSANQKEDQDLTQIIGNIIQWVLGLVGIIAVVLFIYGGFLYMTAAGSDEKIGTAKKLMTGAIIGIIIIALAFAITRYLLQAVFSQTSNR